MQVVRRYSEFLASLLVINHTDVDTITTQPSSPHSRSVPASPPFQIHPPSPPRQSPSSQGDQRVTAWLTVLRTVIERLLDTISSPPEPLATISRDPRRSVFLINNYNLIISAMHVCIFPHCTFIIHSLYAQERGVDTEQFGDDGTRFRYNLKVETSVFVEEELHSFFPKLINFVKAWDSKLLKDPNSQIDKGNPLPSLSPSQSLLL
jgi:hypothetical protein